MVVVTFMANFTAITANARPQFTLSLRDVFLSVIQHLVVEFSNRGAI